MRAGHRLVLMWALIVPLSRSAAKRTYERLLYWCRAAGNVIGVLCRSTYNVPEADERPLVRRDNAGPRLDGVSDRIGVPARFNTYMKVSYNTSVR